MKRIKNLFFIFICFLVLSWDFSTTEEGTLIYLRSSDAINLDPALQWDYYSAEVLYNLMEGLVRTSSRYTVEPWLAERWEVSGDGKIWTFYLRKNVYFHDGSLLDAEDVYFSFRRQMENRKAPAWKAMLGVIEDVKVKGRFSIQIILKQRFAPLLAVLSTPTTFIASSESLQKKPFKPVGTGPFKFKYWSRGSYLVLEANENYWQGKPVAKRLIIKTVEDPNWRILQLKNASADIAEIASLKELEVVKLCPFLDYKLVPVLTVHYLVFNMKKTPFDQKEVRKAFAHLLNKTPLVRLHFGNIAVPAVTPIPPSLPGYNSDIKDYEFSLEKAKNLLEKAGLGEGFECTLYMAKGRPHQKVMVINLIRNARRIGIRIKVKELPFHKLVSLLLKRNYDLAILAWNADIPDADNFLFPLFHSKKGTRNYASFENERLDRILEAARNSYNEKERISLYKKAQIIIHRELPWVPLFFKKNIVAYRKEVEGLRFAPNGYIDFYTVRRISK